MGSMRRLLRCAPLSPSVTGFSIQANNRKNQFSGKRELKKLILNKIFYNASNNPD
jgi:hypothetical protein